MERVISESKEEDQDPVDKVMEQLEFIGGKITEVSCLASPADTPTLCDSNLILYFEIYICL